MVTKALHPIIANWNFDALEMSNCFLVKDGKTTLFSFAITLKTCFFITVLFVAKFTEK